MGNPDSLRPMQPRRVRVLALATATLLIAAACGGTAASPSGAGPSQSAAASDAASPSEAGSASPAASAESSPSAAAIQQLAVEARDFSFGLPAQASAGVTHIALNNTGKELHQAQVARLNADASFEDLTAALQNPDPSGALALLTLVGGPTGVAPGATGSVDLNLEAGAHVFLCFIAGADNVPHIAKGMIAPLEVTEPATAGELPTGDAELTLQDFAFVGLDSLSAGPHTVTVTNNGPQPHEAGVVKLADGVTVPDVIELLGAAEPASGPPPWTDVGGIAGISPGSTATMDVDLPAGDYAFVCFIPDPATGNPHLMLGMIAPLTVE